MGRSRLFLRVGAFVLSMIALSVFAQVKVGFINTERLLRESPAALRSFKRLEVEFDKRRAELRQLGVRIDELQKQLERDGVTMAESERRIRERDLGALTREFQRKQREYREDEDLRMNEERRVLAERANRIVRRIAESEKFTLIVQEAVYVASEIDLTDRVLKAMDEN